MEMYDDKIDMAQAMCRGAQKWGVYCEWEPYPGAINEEEYDAWAMHIIACLPEGALDGHDGNMPTSNFILQLFDTSDQAVDFYSECLGPDNVEAFGVYAVLIGSDGEWHAENS